VGLEKVPFLEVEMNRNFIALAAIAPLLWAGCDRIGPTETESAQLPTAQQAVLSTGSVDAVLNRIANEVISSSAFAGYYPATEGYGLQQLQDLPGGQMEGVVRHVGRGCNEDDYLDDPADAIALIARGWCTFREKALRAHGAGAVGIIVYDSLALTYMWGWTVSDPDITLPGVRVRNVTGLLLRDGTAPVTAVVRKDRGWNLEEAVQRLSNAGLLSNGQSTSLVKKLQLAAAHIERGNSNAARGGLGAFIDQVQELVADGVIAAADGELLIESTRAWMVELAS
jgi:hypothetical protein